MKEQISFSTFTDRFNAIRPNNFSYEGLKALYDYLENYEENTEQEIELDVIALCCEYSEYKNLEEFLKDYNGLTFEEFLKDNYPKDLEKYEQHKKESVKNGLNLSESLFNFIAYVQKDVYKIEEYNKAIEEEIQNKTTLIKFGDDLNEGFIIQQY